MPEPYRNEYGEILPYDSFGKTSQPRPDCCWFMNPQTIAAFAAAPVHCADRSGLTTAPSKPRPARSLEA